MSPSTRRALAGEQGASPHDGPGNEFVAVAVWVRCLMDDRLHPLDRRCVPEIAEFGWLARCRVLLTIEELALPAVGPACPTCLLAGSA